MPDPSLMVEASSAGVKRVIVSVDRTAKEEGFVMLRVALPAILHLDRAIRGGESQKAGVPGPTLHPGGGRPEAG
jgi:hypothetical protein